MSAAGSICVMTISASSALVSAPSGRSKTAKSAAPAARRRACSASTSARKTHSLRPTARSDGSCTRHGRAAERNSASLTSSEATSRLRIDVSTYSGRRSSALSTAAAACASRSKREATRSSSHWATSRIAAASSAEMASSGRASDSRRGAQSARGRASRLSTIGAPISTPSMSPLHQRHHSAAASAAGVTPAATKALVATLALTRHDSGTTNT